MLSVFEDSQLVYIELYFPVLSYLTLRALSELRKCLDSFFEWYLSTNFNYTTAKTIGSTGDDLGGS